MRGRRATRSSRDAAGRVCRREPSRAAAAQAGGKFKDEILPVDDPAEEGRPDRRSTRTNRCARDTTAEVLRALKPAFKKDGSVTAGNAPPVNDGAAALVVMSAERCTPLGVTPMARIVAQATSGLEPKMLLMTPVEATRKVLKKAGWSIDDVDLFELNEAFAVQAVAVVQRARRRHGQGQRQRRRGGARPRDRRLRRAHPDDVALRVEGSRREAWGRDAVPGRRERRRARDRTSVTDGQRWAEDQDLFRSRPTRCAK